MLTNSIAQNIYPLALQLLEREPTKRMGMATCKAGDIYEQAWFKGVDWGAVEALKVQPAFVPEVVGIWLARARSQ